MCIKKTIIYHKSRHITSNTTVKYSLHCLLPAMFSNEP
jgi:hypothetical protein